MNEKDIQDLIEKVQAGTKTGSVFNLRTLSIACLIFFIIGAAAGAFAWDAIEAAVQRHNLAMAKKDLANEKAKPPVQVPVMVKGQDTNTVTYVEKPVYVDAKTGQTVQDPADMVVTSGTKSNFTFGLIGPDGKRKDYTFTKAANEKQVFDKNRLEWVTDWNFAGTVDVRDLVEEVAAARVEKAVADTKSKYLKHYSAGADYWSSGRLDGRLGYTPNGILEYSVMKNISGGTTTIVGPDIGAGVSIHF